MASIVAAAAPRVKMSVCGKSTSYLYNAYELEKAPPLLGARIQKNEKRRRGCNARVNISKKLVNRVK